MEKSNIRDFFPVTKNCTYFQSAGMSPIAQPVLEQIMSGYKQLTDFGDIHWQKDFEKLQTLFSKIASLINCNAHDISFVDNNSLAMSLLGLSLKEHFPQGNIVSLEEEFPSNSVPFEHLGINMKYVANENHRYSVSSILNTCDANTFAVVASHVQYATGFRLDIKTLGAELKKRGILFIVNATQSFPFFPPKMKEMNIDVLTCSVHKWGFCGHIGTLLITSENFRNTYPTPIAGWLSVDVSKSNDFIHTQKNKPFTVWESAQQYNYGSSNLKGRLGLLYSLQFLETWNWELLTKTILSMSEYVIDSLKNLPLDIISPNNSIDERSGIVSFQLHSGKNAELMTFLEQANIIVALRNNNIRVSVNIFTNTQDIDILIHAIKTFISRQN